MTLTARTVSGSGKQTEENEERTEGRPRVVVGRHIRPGTTDKTDTGESGVGVGYVV